ncbi:hypothetical protein DL93DRAFT_2086637 [Clavulina sp. PMI_390]|nr:hypothetical protein DL93DRAFT_2086637 [Clavulina sp. PMI_390]
MFAIGGLRYAASQHHRPLPGPYTKPSEQVAPLQTSWELPPSRSLMGNSPSRSKPKGKRSSNATRNTAVSQSPSGQSSTTPITILVAAPAVPPPIPPEVPDPNPPDEPTPPSPVTPDVTTVEVADPPTPLISPPGLPTPAEEPPMQLDAGEDGNASKSSRGKGLSGMFIATLNAVNSAADAFPPLKSASGGALWIANTVRVSPEMQSERSQGLRFTT